MVWGRTRSSPAPGGPFLLPTLSTRCALTLTVKAHGPEELPVEEPGGRWRPWAPPPPSAPTRPRYPHPEHMTVAHMWFDNPDP